MSERVPKKGRLNRWAKQTGFRKRKGKLSPFDFLVLMTVGQVGMKHPSLAGMVAAIEARISRVALHYRFSAAAAAFLLKCLGFVLQQKVHRLGQIDTKLLRPFRRVLIADSSSWDVSEKLHSVLPGSGGTASAANCKLQAVYDYKRGELGFLDVTAGTVPDNRYTDRLPDMLQKGDLLLIDQGYFKLNTLAEIAARGAFFLTRFFVCTALKDPITHAPIDLAKHLSKLEGNAHEMDVLMGSKRQPQVPCRLIALRLGEQVANERRRRLRREAKRKGRTISKQHLRMCDWTLLITNVPQKWLMLEMARALYTVRWQIELLFKQLKSILRVHESDTSKENRLRCELYGKLIGAVIIHRIHAAETNRLWKTQRREVSMENLYKRFQERAFTLLRMLLRSVLKANAYLCDQIKRILPTCLKNRQRSRLSTLEILEAQCDPMLEIEEPVMKNAPLSLTPMGRSPRSAQFTCWALDPPGTAFPICSSHSPSSEG
ncbi:IS4 family transposase [Candidatus Eisenbacteria bacterium]|uniref:IS4 family transposase n=1 Tax=Eiseniibacteriota bacterium TaxID=2212470 RepID=A0ABV6YM91_UNCEI